MASVADPNDITIDLRGLITHFQSSLRMLHRNGRPEAAMLEHPIQQWIMVLEQALLTNKPLSEADLMNVFRLYEMVEAAKGVAPSAHVPRQSNAAGAGSNLGNAAVMAAVAAVPLLAAAGFYNMDPESQRRILSDINQHSLRQAMRSGNRMGVAQAFHAADTLGLPSNRNQYSRYGFLNSAPAGSRAEMARSAYTYDVLNRVKNDESCNLQGKRRRSSCRKGQIHDRDSKRCRRKKCSVGKIRDRRSKRCRMKKM